MTQEQALAAYQAMCPEKAEKLEATRTRSIGFRTQSEFVFWDWSQYIPGSGPSCLGRIGSTQSWEHALLLVRASLVGEQDNSPVADDEPENELVRTDGPLGVGA